MLVMALCCNSTKNTKSVQTVLSKTKSIGNIHTVVWKRPINKGIFKQQASYHFYNQQQIQDWFFLEYHTSVGNWSKYYQIIEQFYT